MGTSTGSIALKWLEATTRPPVSGTRSTPYVALGASAIATVPMNDRAKRCAFSGS